MDSLYQFVFTANACGVAVLTLLVYDWCISLGSEMTLFWRAPRTSASILYLFNRYCIMLEWALAMLTIQPVSDLSCRGLYYTELVLSYFAMIGPALFSSLRVYALTGQHKLLAGLTLTLALVPLFVNVSAAYQSHPVNRDPPINCSLDSSTPQQLAIILTFLSRSGQTLADLLVVAVTWRETYKLSRIAAQTIQGPTFNQVMLHNGCIYFVVLATLNILHMVLTALSIKIPSGSESFVINFIDPITSILVCHFLISLQEAKHTSQPDTVPSFVHPDLATGSGLDFAVPIPSLRMSMPSFVASLAGPLAVYSTANQSALVDVESHFDDDDIDGGRGSGLSTADSGDLEGASSRDTRTEVVSGCAGLTREKGNILNSAEGEASSSKTYGERSVSAI